MPGNNHKYNAKMKKEKKTWTLVSSIYGGMFCHDIKKNQSDVRRTNRHHNSNGNYPFSLNYIVSSDWSQNDVKVK